jgi:peptidoglycan LD-endopeptidase CwlK
MPTLGAKSRAALDTCDHRIVMVAERAIKIIDYSVTQGYRSVEEQQEFFSRGRKQLPSGEWVVVDQSKVITKIDGIKIKGMHNHSPSLAIDVVPFPIDWANRARFTLLAGIFLGIAHEKGVKLRWGGAWKGDFTLPKQTFDDLPHFELVE